MFDQANKSDIILVGLASVLAANGLISNNISAIISSMLVAPYLGTVVSIGNKLANNMAVGSDPLLMLVYLGISLLVGVVYNLFNKAVFDNYKDAGYVKSRLVNRSVLDTRTVLSLVIFSIVSGVTLAYVASNNAFSPMIKTVVLVGISIGVSLLPPVVNSGLLIAEGEWNYVLSSLGQSLITVLGL